MDDEDEENASSQTIRNTALEFPLHVLLECLNIFGTAVGSSASSSTSTFAQRQPQVVRRDVESEGSGYEDADEEDGEGGDKKGLGRRGRQGKIDSFFAKTDGKGTGMRLSYAGAGHPLVLLL